MVLEVLGGYHSEQKALRVITWPGITLTIQLSHQGVDVRIGRYNGGGIPWFLRNNDLA
jgi:hypothetical protein